MDLFVESWIKFKVNKLKELNSITGRTTEEVVREALIAEVKREYKKVKTYIVDIIKYENLAPVFKSVVCNALNSAEAVRYAAEIEGIEDNDDTEQDKAGILKVSRISGLNRSYSEKDILNVCKIILENIKQEEILMNMRTIMIDNKALIVEAIMDKYDIRNRMLLDIYREVRHRGKMPEY